MYVVITKYIDTHIYYGILQYYEEAMAQLQKQVSYWMRSANEHEADAHKKNDRGNRSAHLVTPKV